MRSKNLNKSKQHLSPTNWFWGLGHSTQEVRAQMKIAASRDLSVLIVGETGTGKEVVAREIHRLRCPDNPDLHPFLPVNCGAVHW
jgi:DNA-binding NtrC family response regulator